MKKIKSFFYSSIIVIIEIIEEFMNSSKDTESFKVKDTKVKSKDGNKKVDYVHKCERDYIYEVILKNGVKINLTKTHKVYCNSEFLAIKDIMDYKYEDYFLQYDSNLSDGKSLIVKIKKSYFKYFTYDITVNNDIKSYFANGVEVHNCVTYKTDINLYNAKDDILYNNVPIFEIYYRNKKNKTFLDNIEYFLHKVLYKLEK